jgi:PAS domain S-box-containing protein
MSRTSVGRPSIPGIPLNDLSAARVWGMIESAPDGMLMIDEGGTILAVNRQVESLFGYERVELLGRPIEILLPDSFREVHRAHRTRYRVDPGVREMGVGLELRARRADGSEFPVEVGLSPLLDDDDQAIVASVRDVSDRVAATRQLARIQAAIDAVHDGVFMFEPATLRFVYVNDGAIAQVGYTRAELLSMTPLHIKPDFTDARFKELIAPLVAGEVDHLSFRTTHRHRSGHDVSVDIMLEHRANPIDSGDSLLVAVVRDVGDQVEIERRLATSERMFRTSFEDAPVGMTLIRLDGAGRGVIVQANQSFASMLDRSVESLVGADCADFTHPDDGPSDVRAAVEMADGSRDAHVSEKRYRRNDGSYVWVLLHSSVIDRSSGALTLVHLVNITDRRERQREQTRLAKMEDRERIARDLHDLVIQRLFAAGMKLQAVVPEMGSDLAVKRTNETIDDLDATIRELRASIFSLHRVEPLSLRAQIDDELAAIETTLGFHPSLKVVGDLAAVPGTVSEQLMSAVREALSNIGRHAHAASVEVCLQVDDECITLVVDDDGVGAETTSNGGNGISNMSERALRLGGSFDISCREPAGTRVTWSVPR